MIMIMQTSSFQILVWSMDYCAAVVYYGYQYVHITPSLPEIYQKNSFNHFNNHCKFN